MDDGRLKGKRRVPEIERKKELNEIVCELRRVRKKLAEHTQRTRSVSVLSQSLVLSPPSLPVAR